MMYKLSLTVLILTCGLIVALFIIFYYPITVIKPNVARYKILTPLVKVGEQVVYVVDACKYIDTTSTVARTFVDGVRYPSITSTNNVPKGCSKTRVAIQVPNYIYSGKYHLELDVVYHINALRDVTYHFETETFTVAGGSASLSATTKESER